jgi:Mrp family chromosome partitioning ATPase
MLQKIIKPDTQENAAFDLLTAAGSPAYSFPGKVIDNLRYLIARAQRSQPFPARLGMISALRGEGVTYLAHALGATLAQDRPAQICVVDLNWHWPVPSPFAGPENKGLADVLSGTASLDKVIAPTNLYNLWVLPAGSLDKERRSLVAGCEALRAQIDQLSLRFDHLILDLPAVLATSDALTLAPLSTACCMVIRQGMTNDSDVRAALDVISHLNILGAVLNQVSYYTPAPWIDVLLDQE